MSYIKVDGHNNLVRDSRTNTILNMNSYEHQEYVSRRSTKDEENKRIQNLESDFVNMKSDLDEIKNLLRSLINENGSR